MTGAPPSFTCKLSDKPASTSRAKHVFGHLKDEFFRERRWGCFESFKADLDAYFVHRNARRRQVKLKGLTPKEFRGQSLAA